MKNLMTILLMTLSSIAFATETKMKVHIDGMTCPSCVASIEKEFKKLPEVSAIDINIRKGVATISLKDAQSLSIEEIEKAVKDAGYVVKKVE